MSLHVKESIVILYSTSSFMHYIVTHYLYSETTYLSEAAAESLSSLCPPPVQKARPDWSQRRPQGRSRADRSTLRKSPRGSLPAWAVAGSLQNEDNAKVTNTHRRNVLCEHGSPLALGYMVKVMGICTLCTVQGFKRNLF